MFDKIRLCTLAIRWVHFDQVHYVWNNGWRGRRRGKSSRIYHLNWSPGNIWTFTFCFFESFFFGSSILQLFSLKSVTLHSELIVYLKPNFYLRFSQTKRTVKNKQCKYLKYKRYKTHFENSALSAIDKYCFARNLRSSASSCWVVKGVLGFRLLLCLRSWHFTGARNRKCGKLIYKKGLS